MRVFKKAVLYFLFIFAGVIIASAAAQSARIAMKAGTTAYTQIPFERRIPEAQLKILFLGDSTAVGTGAASNTQSTAGYFGQDFPDADITNISRNGKKLSGLLKEFDPKAFGHYNLVVIQIGANDILKFTPMRTIERDVIAVIERAKIAGDHVVILHSGNVGLAPIFTWPFDAILTERSRRVRAIYMREAKLHGALYADLFSERSNDLLLSDVSHYYSPDHLHPSGYGYRWWYERIRQTLAAGGVNL